ncbi:endoplasmic reticulum membrane-associated RNA degradation protein-like isoform X2 [Clavelina lepadiformis]|uniref:endoplasmic reticulum membrane-associated RNA degradation protein-like isoform X2 n=1 Tax=Clavelina lepadiformis TaxID=159417 RepID=UPI00404298B3
MDISTFLSQDVKQIVVDIWQASSHLSQLQHKTEKVCHKFETLTCRFYELITSVLEENQLSTTLDFHTAVQELCPLFHQLLFWDFESDDIERFVELLSNWFIGISKQDIQDWFKVEYLSADTEVNLCLVLKMLYICSTLEHSLRSVYRLKDGHDPLLLRDLLSSKPLKETFGETRMKFLQVLFGGPLSLNLRNLLWHGFISPNELPSMYFHVLLFTIVEMSVFLDDQNLLVGMKKLPLVQKDFVRGVLNERLATTLRSFEANRGCDVANMNELYETSPYIPKSMLVYFKYSLNLYRSRRFGDCVMILLPQLEHLLRCRFSFCNKCPERVMTAESTEFYTTLDDVLSSNLKQGGENYLRYELGDNFMVLLRDLFVLQDGLRLRDHLSHGEMSSIDVDHNIAFVVVSAALYASHGCARKHEETGYTRNERDSFLDEPDTQNSAFNISFQGGACCTCQNNDLFRQISTFINNYESLFHALAFTKRDVCSSVKLCFNFKDTPSIENFNDLKNSVDSFEVDELVSSLKLLSIQYAQLAKSTVADSNFVEQFFTSITNKGDVKPLQESDQIDQLIEFLAGSHLHTLHRQISLNVKKAAENIKNILEVRKRMFKERSLRSRQRKNYICLLCSRPVLFAGLRFLTLYILVLIHHHGFMADTPQRLLRKLLQICENVVTFTSADVNKWKEAVNLMAKLSKLIPGL